MAAPAATTATMATPAATTASARSWSPKPFRFEKNEDQEVSG
jgi:hypothetical protein